MGAALATLIVMEEEDITGNAARLGAKAIARMQELGKTCPFFAEVRGKGLMFGIDFHRPEASVKLKAAWDALHLLNEGVFSQTVVMPLMHEHGILTQVAGYHTELIKFLPPLNITEAELDYFLNAMQSVLDGLQSVRGSAWNTVRKLTKAAAAEFVR
jgi:4-aminobutyrate aminotransferase-like enzyme